MESEIAKLACELTMKATIDEALPCLLDNYISERIANCKKEIKKFEKKYGMTFEEYEQKLGETIPLFYEHEIDYGVWGAKIDELKELKKRKLPNDRN